MGCTRSKLELPIEKYVEIQSALMVSFGGMDNAEQKLNEVMFTIMELVKNKHQYRKKDRKAIDGLYESAKKRYYRIKQWKNRKRNLTW
jgi:hypothetical protein